MSNKENEINRVNDKTKIPLPVGSLPELPKHVALRRICKEARPVVETKRPPLALLQEKYLSQLPSSRKIRKENAIIAQPLKLSYVKNNKRDDKYVTVRKHNYSPLDWNLAVFGQDDNLDQLKENENAQIAPRKSMSERKEPKVLTSTAKKNALTPTFIPSCEHSRVKNIKRSLKRPHSRELLGLTAGVEEKSQVSLSIDLKGTHVRKLDFENENMQGGGDFQQAASLRESYGADIIAHLLEQEKKWRPARLPRTGALSRSIVVDWLSGIVGHHEKAKVFQISVRHLDRLLCLDEPDVARLQLLAAACCWLAQKQEATARTASSMVRTASGAYTRSELIRAEKYVLRRLVYPPTPVVAGDFVPYWCFICNPEEFEELEQAATYLCAAAMLDVQMSAARPSVLAAAAVSTALQLLDRSKTVIKKLQNCPIYQSVAEDMKFRQLGVELVRAAYLLGDPRCPARQCFNQYVLPPYCVAPRLANSARNIIDVNLPATPLTQFLQVSK